MPSSACLPASAARRLLAVVSIALAVSTAWRTDAHAASLAPPPPNLTGVSGGSLPIDGESVIYAVRLFRGGPPENLVSIAVQINGTGSPPLRSVDIDRLRLYTDTNGNGVWDSGVDAQVGVRASVSVGGTTTVPDGAGTALPAAPVPGLWFFVTISFNASAADRRFTVGAPVNNIVGTNAPANGFLASGLALFVWDPEDRVTPIPVGGEWIAGLLFFGSGVYWLMRRRKAT